MLSFANAKINLGLHITGRREDGYHLLESLFLPVPLCDIVEILPASEEATDDSLMVLGDIDTGCLEDNLVLRAVRRLRQDYPFPYVSIVLKKLIPSGAGMGGGSSDASFTLRTLRELFALPVTDEELRAIALTLGADCPFFIANKPALVRGIGEVLLPAPALDLSRYQLVVVKPPLHISTAEAFRGLGSFGGQAEDIPTILSRPIAEWRDSLANDFERSLFPNHPELALCKARLYELGAVYASMTGSGAALYGFFERPLSSEERATFEGCFFWQGRLTLAE